MNSDDMPTKKPDAPVSKSPFGRLRRYFFTGLVILAPVAITVWVTIWFIGVFDSWVKPLVPTNYNPDHYLPFKVPGTGLVFALALITLVGFLGANLVGRTIIGWWDGLVNRTPVVRSIYKGSKQIFETMFSEKGASFQKVCLVEWPRRDAWSVAFISRELDSGQIGMKPGTKMYAVYVSTTPNPTSGYVFFVKESEVQVLDMTVEDGLKLVISMGLVFPDAPLKLEEEIVVATSLTRRSRGDLSRKREK
jgi:uncharacterized membrane protein